MRLSFMYYSLEGAIHPLSAALLALERVVAALWQCQEGPERPAVLWGESLRNEVAG